MTAGYYSYLLFMISWFLHVTARIPLFGAIRLDLLLVIITFAFYLASKKQQDYDSSYYRLIQLLIVILLVTPFAEWPGSVINVGLPQYIKAIVFYFFSIHFITDESKIKTFIYVFFSCHLFRVLEPLYLNKTQGYWGSSAHMLDGAMQRLAGAPSDTVNPNGLAYIIIICVAFMFYLYNENKAWAIVSLIGMPACFYALSLTGSRSGYVSFLVLIVIRVLQSKKKTFLAATFAIALFGIFTNMSDVQKDRIFSIYDEDSQNYATANARKAGIIADFNVFLRRPLFGHGLGTSYEAISNYSGRALYSHNVYTEVLIELGIIGFIFFIRYLASIFKILRNTSKMLISDDSSFNYKLSQAIFNISVTTLVFGFFSYGFSGYEWYVFGALALVNANLMRKNNEKQLLEPC